jgi:hypothetical protein
MICAIRSLAIPLFLVRPITNSSHLGPLVGETGRQMKSQAQYPIHNLLECFPGTLHLLMEHDRQIIVQRDGGF